MADNVYVGMTIESLISTVNSIVKPTSISIYPPVPGSSAIGEFTYGQTAYGSAGISCTTLIGANTLRVSKKVTANANQLWAEYGTDGIVLIGGQTLLFPTTSGTIATQEWVNESVTADGIISFTVADNLLEIKTS